MAERPTRILLVDDEQAILTLLSYPLAQDGYEVVRAADGVEAMARFGETEFDLVVLDVTMPHMDGLEVCRRMRATSSVPIIMLTAKTEEIDKVLGLELGADDYITKPFSMEELLARVRANLRRVRTRETLADERVIQTGDLVIEPKSFNDAEQIGAKFKNDTPVIVNLQSIDRDLAKRLIDFVSGLTYGLDGGIQRVAEMVFLLTPANIEVSAEDRKWMREKGFFNQF